MVVHVKCVTGAADTTKINVTTSPFAIPREVSRHRRRCLRLDHRRVSPSERGVLISKGNTEFLFTPPPIRDAARSLDDAPILFLFSSVATEGERVGAYALRMLGGLDISKAE